MKPAAWNDTMQMRMEKQVLSPPPKYGEKADLGAQMLGIGSDGGQGLGSGSEENAVDEILVLASDGSDLFGRRHENGARRTSDARFSTHSARASD
jgi:hypothetical protein